jgi:hypothetical protein
VVLGAKKRILLHTIPSAGSQSFEGILMAKGKEYVLDLASLQTGEDKDEVVQIKGRVHILRDHIAFYQVEP